MFKGRDAQRLSCQPASTTCCPCHGDGEESSKAQLHWKGIANFPFPNTQTQGTEHIPETQRSPLHQKINIPCSTSSPAGGKSNKPKHTGSLVQGAGNLHPALEASLSLLHHKGIARFIRAVTGAYRENHIRPCTTSAKSGSALWRTTVSSQPSFKVK